MRPEGPGTALGAVDFHRAADRLARIARARFGRGMVSGAGAAPARDGGVTGRPWAAPVRLAAAAPLLAVAAALLLPAAPAEAQTTFVSNTGQPYDEDERDFVGPFRSEQYSLAQRFRTGGQAGGYLLGSVELNLFGIGNLDVPKVSIHSVNANGSLGSSVYVLTNPGRFVDRSSNTFTAPPDATLAANTNYAVVVEATDGAFGVGVTTRFTEDSGSASGWSIGDGADYRYSDSGNWILLTSRALRIAVKELAPNVSFRAATYGALEGGSAERVTVRLLPAQASPVSVPLTATPLGGAEEADYTGIPASLAFAANETSKTFTVTAVDDADADPGESVRIAFGALPQGIAAGSPATVKLIDNDHTSEGSIFDTVLTVGNSGQGCSDSSNYECSEGLGAHTFTSTDSQGVARTFTIGGLSVGTVTSGENRGNRNLWFWVSPDKLFRDYENHRLVLVLDGRRFPFRTSDSAANSRRVKVWEDTGLTWRQGRTVRVEILDLPNAAPSAAPNRGHPWFAVADAEANEADGYMDFTVKLRRPTVDGSPLLIGAEVDYATADGTAVAGEDYTHTTGTLTFGADQEKATVRVPLIDDAVEDDGETFTLLLSNPTGATIADGEATGTIRNTEGLTASFENVPESHAGSGEFTLRLAFSEALAAGGAGRKIGQALVLSGATRGTVFRVDGRRDLYEFTVRPTGNGAVTVSLPATTGACDADDAICTAGGEKLSGAVRAEIAGPDTGQEPQASLTASFASVPASHDGSSAFTVRVAFSEAVSTGFRAMRDDAFTVTGGSVNRAKRVDGASDLWEIRVAPSGSGAVTVRLPATTGDCTATGAVCTSDDERLSVGIETTVPGPAPALTGASVDGATLTLTWDEALDEGSVPGTDAFAVTVAGAARGVTGVSVRGSTAALTLVAAVAAGETVTVGYTVPAGAGASPIRDATGNPAAGFPAESVTNATRAGNTAPTCLPAIAGTAAVGETLTASSSGIADDDGLTNATFAWQWIANDGTADADIAGATGATYTLTAAEAGQTIRVRATFTDDGGTEETLTSAATSAVALNLTASFIDVPSEHDGSGAFEVRVLFSEALAAGGSGRKIAQALALTGATRGTVRRVDGRRDLYWFRLRPSGNGAVTVSLASTGACGGAAAVCTSDGRALSNVPAATIAGPPSLSVADAEVNEGANAALAFAVALSRAVSSPVTVDYATSDVTATAGDDYTAASGTLTFAAGETSKTVAVAVLDDVHDDGGETLTLSLSNPSGAWLSDATATGTIHNTDLMPQAWLGRFGRTVADQVLDAVAGRMTAPRTPGVEASLAGHRVDFGPGTGSGSGGSASPAIEAREAEATLAALADVFRGADDDGATGTAAFGSREVTGRELLSGSSFALTGGSAESGFGALWGRGAVTRFDGREGALTLDGEVTSALLGADWTLGRGTAGLVVAHSLGEGGYRSEAGAGTVESALTGLYPWGRYAVNQRLAVWGVAGHGSGTLTLTPAGQAAIETDLALAMGAVGGRGVLVEPPADGGLELGVRSDALLVRTTSEAVQSNAGGNLLSLAAADAAVTRLRLGLEGTWHGIDTPGGGSFEPSFEVGVRHDGGDAETGFGVDVGAGLAWTDPSLGIRAQVAARGLLTHDEDGFRERGLAGSLAWDPSPSSALGPSLSLSQAVGAEATGGMDALLRPDTAWALGAAGANRDDPGRRAFEAKLGYGLALAGGRYTGTPELGLGWSEHARETTLRWRVAETQPAGLAFGLDVEGARSEGVAGDAAPEHRLGLGLGWRLEGSGAGSLALRVEAARRLSANDDRAPENQLGLTMTARW